MTILHRRLRWAVLSVGLLPAPLLAAGAVLSRPPGFHPTDACQTVEVLGGSADRDPAAAAALAARPDFKGDESSYAGDAHFLLHYSRRQMDPAAWRSRRALPAVLPEGVAETAQALAAARQALLERRLWPEAAPQRPLDVFLLAARPALGSRAVPVEDLDLSAEEGSASFIVVTGPPASWPSQAVHQYLHALQIARSMREAGWFYESSALYLEEVIGGGGAVPAQLISRRLERPQRSLTATQRGLRGGGVLYLAFLGASLGDGFVQDAWEMAGRRPGENSLGALDAALRLGGATSFEETWRAFTIVNGYPDPHLRPEGVYGRLTPSVPLARAARVVTSLPEGDPGPGSLLIEPLGAAYVRMHGFEDAAAVQIEIESEPGSPLAADALVSWRHGAEGWLTVPFRFAEGRAELGIPVEPGTQIVIVVRHEGGNAAVTAGVAFSAFADPSFPFDLSFLAADAAPGAVEVSWGSESERRMYGWTVYRALDPQGPFVRLNALPLPSPGESAGPLDYRYIDTTVESGRLYYYLVEGMTEDGLARRSPVVARRALAPARPPRP